MAGILLVLETSDPEAISQVQFELRKAFQASGEDVNINIALDEEDAKAKLARDIALLITPLEIRKTAVTPLSQDDDQALDLLRWVAKNQINVPSILIVPTYTDELIRAQPELGRCYVVKSGAHMVQEVVKAAVQIVHNAPAKCLDIEVQLRSSREWTYQMKGRGFAFQHESDLLIDTHKLEDLKDLADALAGDRWQSVLGRFGCRLLDLISNGEGSFLSNYFEGVLQAGGEQNTRLRFAVRPGLHDLPLEAVTCPRHRDRHWMLHAPVYRRLLVDEPSNAGFRFGNGQQGRCLIIDATTSGWVDVIHRMLDPLRHTAQECDWLQGWLRQRMDDFNMAEPVILRATAGVPLWKQVKEQLESRDWTIVHYAGHSYCESDGKTGYVFFPGASQGSIEAVELKRFSDALRRVTFTYFSSCDSGAGPFVFELAGRRVSSILGFRWEIGDDLASEFAKEFYQTLFEKHSLEQAFLKARQQMHDAHPDDRIWAAPILIKQIEENA